MEDSLFEVEGERFEASLVGVEGSESVASRDWTFGMVCADGSPSGPNFWMRAGAEGCVVVGVADVLSVVADGVVKELDRMRGGIGGVGRRSSVYTSRRMFDRPTMAAG